MLRQTKRITSLLQSCDKQYDAFGISLKTAEVLRLDLNSPAAVIAGQSLFSTQAADSNLNLAGTPESLAYPRQPVPVSPGKDKPGLVQSVMLYLGGYYSKESRLMRAAGGLYDSVTEIAVNPRFLKAFEIPDDFQYQHAALCLHMWLLLTRLRPEGKEAKELAQIFYDNFQDDLEMRVRAAGVKVKVRGQLAELEKQFYGSCMAYDKALKKEGTETLDKALLRNVYQGDDDKKAVAGKLERSSKSASTAAEKGNTSTPVLIALAAGLAGFFWWRWNQQKKGGGNAKGGRSPFKFSGAAKTGKTKSPNGPTPVAATASSSLPRNKASNNKKNKARRKDEKKARQAEKEQQAAQAAAASSRTSSAGGTGSGDQGQPSTAVLNYTYFDTARRDTILPIHKKPKLTAADVMKKETDSTAP